MVGAYSADPAPDAMPTQQQQQQQHQQHQQNESRLRDNRNITLGVNSNANIDQAFWELLNTRGGLPPSTQQQHIEARLRNRSPNAPSSVSMDQVLLGAINRATHPQQNHNSQIGGQRQPTMEEIHNILARTNGLSDPNAMNQLQLRKFFLFIFVIRIEDLFSTCIHR